MKLKRQYGEKKEERQIQVKKRSLRKMVLFGIAAVSVVMAGHVSAAPDNPDVSGIWGITQPESQALLETLSGNDGTESVSGSDLYNAEGDPLPGKLPDVFSVMVDAGHGGADYGCGTGGILEKDINLEIAKRLQVKLEEKGYQAVLVREADTYIDKESRVEMANAFGADVYVSIHQNMYDAGDAEGIEVWYDGSDASRDSAGLAAAIHEKTLQATGAARRALWPDADFCVTGQTVMPACLIETGFLSNAAEKEQLTDSAYQEKIAEGIAEGIELYFSTS